MKDAKGHGSDARGGAGAGKDMWGRTDADLHKDYGGPVVHNDGKGAHQEGVNQVGQESPKSQGLRLFADNDANLHRQSFQPIMSNLEKKTNKGIYDPQKAEKLWGYHADRAAQAMHKQSGAPGAWHQAFPTSVRREAAGHWERAHRK